MPLVEGYEDMRFEVDVTPKTLRREPEVGEHRGMSSATVTFLR